MQFIEYLLKYRIQSYGNGFPTEHDLKKLYGMLTDDDQSRIEACFGKLTTYNEQRDPESFDTIKEFVERYWNSYTFCAIEYCKKTLARTRNILRCRHISCSYRFYGILRH